MVRTWGVLAVLVGLIGHACGCSRLDANNALAPEALSEPGGT